MSKSPDERWTPVIVFALALVLAWMMSSSWLGFALWVAGSFYGLVLLCWVILKSRSALGWLAALPLLPVAWFRWWRHRTLHGSARFATTDERQRYHNGGQIHVGTHRDIFGRERALTVDEATGHVCCLGMTGGGKTTSLFLPSLLSLRQSVVVWDWKGTLYAASAGYRARVLGQKIIRFAPGEEVSAKFNPLSIIRLGTDDEILDARLIMQTLAEGNGPTDPKDRHWEETSVGLLTGVCLYVCYRARAAGTEATLAEVANAFGDPALPINKLFDAMTAHPHHFVRSQGEKNRRRMSAAKSGEELSIISTAERYVEPFLYPAVARNTATSDLVIEDLQDGDAKGCAVSLYLATKADHAEVLAPVMRLFLACLCKRLQCRDLSRPVTHKLTLLLDEFSSLGHCAAVAAATPRLREYGVSLVFGVQSINDFVRLYGPHSTFLGNCSVKAVYTVEGVDAEFVSKTLGVSTRSWLHRSQTIGQQISDSAGRQYFARQLMTADEVAAGDPDRMWLFEAGRRPVYGWKILSWNHPVFKARAAVSEDEAEPIPGAANDNPFPAVPIPAAAKAVAAAAVLAMVATTGFAWHSAPRLPKLPSPAPFVAEMIGYGDDHSVPPSVPAVAVRSPPPVPAPAPADDDYAAQMRGLCSRVGKVPIPACKPFIEEQR